MKKRSFAQAIVGTFVRLNCSRLRSSLFHYIGLCFRDGREQAHGICDG